VRLSSFQLPLGAKSVGRRLGHLALHAAGVRVVSLRRGDGRNVRPDDETLLEQGDTVVLSGIPENLAIAEQKLMKAQ
jgi:CPA2 family monovalent cation:H+ antiporter-2